jgi:hypothetical protein
MKKLLTILFCVLTIFVNATNIRFSYNHTWLHPFASKWYVDNTAVGSSNSGSISNPWTSLASITWGSIASDDSVLLKAGDTFNEKFTIGASGTSGHPIIIGRYGSGANPVITGFSSVSSWTNVSGNIWESTSAVKSSALMLNMVTVGGTFQAIGRYPKVTASNGGWLTTTTNTWSGGSAPWTGSVKGVLAGSVDYTGGEVVMRKKHWVIDRATITSQSYSGGSITVNFTQNASLFSNTEYPIQNGYGFFFQNDADACTIQNDWYYNTSTRKLGMYSSGSPSSVKVAAIDTLVLIPSRSYLTFYGLDITGANACNIYASGSCSNLTFDHCNISYGGGQAFRFANGITNTTIQYSTIAYMSSDGINAGNGSNFTCQYNTIHDIDMIAGMGQGGDGDGFTIQTYGSSALIQYNELYNCGYLGITMNGSNCTTQYNYVHEFCQIKDDGAAFYTYDADVPGSSGSNRQYLNNLAINGGGIATDYGTDGQPSAVGFYLDGSASYCNVKGNTAANIWGTCFHSNSPTYDTIINNTFYNGRMSQFNITEYSVNVPSNIISKHNIMFAKDSSLTADFQRRSSSISSWGTFDSNYYCRPIWEPSGVTSTGCNNAYTYLGCAAGAVIERFDILSGNGPDYSLDTWITNSSQDAHSKKSPKTITSTDSLKFVYNATNANVEISLGATYFGPDSTVYDGYITLAPYTSSVLIYRSAFTTLYDTSSIFRYIPSNLRFTYNNPVRDFLTMNIPSGSRQSVMFDLSDIYGREFIKKKSSVGKGNE